MIAHLLHLLSMGIKVFVSSLLAKEIGLSQQLTVDAITVRDLLAMVEKKVSGFKDSICDETGKIRPYVNVFVNGVNIRTRENALSTPLEDGDSVHILPSIAGG